MRSQGEEEASRANGRWSGSFRNGVLQLQASQLKKVSRLIEFTYKLSVFHFDPLQFLKHRIRIH